MIGYGTWILLLSMSFAACGMDSLSDSENVSPDLLGSWIIVRALDTSSPVSQSLNSTPLNQDLEILCTAATECASALHKELVPLFKKCNLPLPESTPRVALRASLDTNGNVLDSMYVEDYASPFSSSREIPFSRTPSPESDESNGLLKSIIAYPAYPLHALLKKITHTPRSKVTMPNCNIEASMAHHAQYESVLKRATQLLNTITDKNTTKITALANLKKQLKRLQAATHATLERVEEDRESFNVLLGCITAPELTLSDNFLLQFCTMRQHDASLGTMLTDFGLQATSFDAISQTDFITQWSAIQEAYKEGRMPRAQFDKLRQYTYVLQNATSRFLTEQFIQGSINNYGMSLELARARGITPARIEKITYELSHCKDFLSKLSRAFDQALKTIDAKLID